MQDTLSSTAAMARLTTKKARGGNAGNQKEKEKGPLLYSQALRTRSMDEILRVDAIDFGLGIGEVHTPKSSFQQLKQRSEVRYNFNEWLQPIHQSVDSHTKSVPRSEGMSHVSIFQELNDEIDMDDVNGDIGVNTGARIVNNNVSAIEIQSKLNETVNREEIEISFEDIEEEVNFWNSSLICYVVGSNPLIQVMEGFFRRVWKSHGVDKVMVVKKGIFPVLFRAMESRDNVLDGHYFFNNKPLVLKPWTPDVDFERENIKTLPI